MEEKDLRKIQSKYSSVYNKLEQKMINGSKLKKEEFEKLEAKYDEVSDILDLIDDALDAYKDNDMEYALKITEELKGRLGD